jgi:hypothetical protein
MAKKTKPERTRTSINLEHLFTAVEREEIVGRLSRALSEKTNLEEQLKSITKDFKAKISTCVAVVNESNLKVMQGKEIRSTDVIIEFDRKSGKKSIFSTVPGKPDKLGKLIKQEDMTEADFQRLPIENLPPEVMADGKKKKKGKKAEAEELQEEMQKNQIVPEEPETEFEG